LTDKHARSQWVAEKVQYARENFLDGINVDFESDIPGDKPKEKKGLTLLMQELNTAFKKAFPHSQVRTSNGFEAVSFCHSVALLCSIVAYQVSIDVAWSPKCIDLRCYDYAALAAAADLSFVMAYDERSQIFGDCVAWSNSPMNSTLYGSSCMHCFLGYSCALHFPKSFIILLAWTSIPLLKVSFCFYLR
jgi:di-N-acetylchitobiase